MASTLFSCNICVNSDPTNDTVKVDPDLLLGDNRDKENAQPPQLHTQRETPAQVRKRQAEKREKQAELSARRLKEQEEAAADAARQKQERLQREAQKAAEEKAWRDAEEKRREEEAAAVAAAAAAAAAAASAEDQRLREEAQRAAEEQAQREREAVELVAAQAKVQEWCNNNGFRDLRTPKKTYMGASKFPLHTAVKHKQEEIVGLLLKCGADKFAKDSREQTASELAANINRNGSHDQILTLLL